MNRCSFCGHVQLNCTLPAEEVESLYTNYYPRRFMDIEDSVALQEPNCFGFWLNGLNSSAFRWVSQNVRVLDIGCGFGQSLGYHTARGCDVYGVEADENIWRVAAKFGYKVHVGLFDDQNYAADFFDYITLDQVIEHMQDPLSTLQGVTRILKPGGTIILSTPNATGWGARIFGRRWINWHAPYHLQFFSKKSLYLAALESGLKVETIKTITHSDWLLYQWLHLVTYPKSGELSIFWSPFPGEKSKSIIQKLLVGCARLAHLLMMNHLLTRFFDALGLGDNYLVVLKKL